MKILALIPARGGSKRLPGKNIRLLGDKPLIVWSIDIIKGMSEICDVLVSTDDPLIAAISTKAGANVPWKRPADLATDTASSVDVALHALNWYESEKGPIDGLLLLQPTSPFRSRKTVRNGIELFQSSGHQPVLGISQAATHPMQTLKLEGNFVVPYMKDYVLNMQSKELTNAFIVNGSLYLITPADLRKNRTFNGGKTVPLLIESPHESLDIDTEWDFMMAEQIVKNKIKHK